jgi:hypothetical protein
VQAGTDLTGAQQIEKQLNQAGYPDTFVVAL